jgi:hypothetical protein
MGAAGAAIAGIAAAAGGGLVSGYAAYESGKAEADIAAQNERAARWQAADAYRRGAAQVGLIRTKASAAAGSARAAMAANNVASTSGSPADLLASSAVNAEMDVATVRANAAREAWGYEVEATIQRGRAKQARFRSYLGMAGGLLGAGASAAESYGRYTATQSPTGQGTGG